MHDTPVPTTTDEAERPLGRPPRSGRGPRDMALSMAVLLVPVALIVVLFRFFGGEQIQVVDPSSAIAQARSAGAFTVLTPRGLAEGWLPTSANCQTRESDTTLRIGYLTPNGDGVQLVESNQNADVLLGTELSSSARLIGAVTVDGAQWQSYTARPGEKALVLVEADRTIIVIGHPDSSVLAVFASSLA